jgi:hypothetical protein
MSRFTEAQFILLPDGRAQLTSDLVYEVDYLGSGWYITAEAYFISDLVSPRWLQKLLSRTKFTRNILRQMARSAILHDKLRVDPRRSKLLGDLIFFEAMGVDKVPNYVRVLAFLLVLCNFSRY